MNKKVEVNHLCEQLFVRSHVKKCQMKNHIQQVAYSTYHDALTQICFTCNKIRTTLKIKEMRK